MGRIILAVVAGFVFWSALWLVAGVVVYAVVPDAYDEDGGATFTAGVLLVYIVVALMISLIAGWLAALIGRDAGHKSAMVLALVLLAVGLAVEISTWADAPVWYHLVFLGLLVPATMGGAALKR